MWYLCRYNGIGIFNWLYIHGLCVGNGLQGTVYGAGCPASGESLAHLSPRLKSMGVIQKNCMKPWVLLYQKKDFLMISLLPYDVIKYEAFLLIFPANSWIKTLIPQLPADWFKHVGLRLTQCVACCRRLGCRLHTLDAPMKTKIAADHSWLKKSTAVTASSWTKLTMYGPYFFLPAEVVWSQQSGGWGNQGKCHPDRKSNWKWLEPAWTRGQ